MALTRIANWVEALKNTTLNLTAVNQSNLHTDRDYGLDVFSIASGLKQRAHYHTYGEIDYFMVMIGTGILHLAKIENNRRVPGSEETHFISAGDTYFVRPYTLHGIENTGESDIVVLNIAPGAHSAPMNSMPDHVVDIFFPATD